MSEEKISVDYPLRENKTSQWTPEFRREWNRKYRQEIKEGKRQPRKQSDKPSKWDDKQFRRAYDEARAAKILQQKTEKKLSFDVAESTRPNYTTAEKQQILDKFVEMIREGSTPSHPYFQLALTVRPEFKRVYPRQKKESS